MTELASTASRQVPAGLDGTAERDAPPETIFPFIVGSTRSGTTLVRALLDSHPELAIPPESYFIVTFARRLESFEVEGAFDVGVFADDLLAHPRFQRWEMPEDAVRDELRRRAPRDLSEAIRAIYRLYAERQGKPRWADKTPRYAKDVARLSELFPESRFVHVIRDGRDATLSQLEVGWGPGNVVEAALRWRNYVETGRRDGRRLGDERYMELSYEELVADPAAALRPVCAFLGLEYDDRMLAYVERAEEIIAPNYYPEGHARIRLPPTSGLRDWRTEMAPEQLAKFELIAGDLLAKLGYERGMPGLEARPAGDGEDEEGGEGPRPAGSVAAEHGVDLGDELPVLAREMARLRKRANHAQRQAARARHKRGKVERQAAKEIRRTNKRADRRVEKWRLRREKARRQRRKRAARLRAIESSRWWQWKLRINRYLRPFQAFQARRRLR